MDRISTIANKVARVQMLLTQRDRSSLPKLYSQEKVEDPMVWVKFFHPYGLAHGWQPSLTGMTRSLGR